jgi:adenylate cyclase class IV
MKYEVEYKVELSEDEVQNLKQIFIERDFTNQGTDQQDDYYIEAEKSPMYKGSGGGYNIKRYRNESGKIIYTEKVWEMVGDTSARRETERNASQDEFETEISKYPDAIKIKKQREWFAGSSSDLPSISITIDSVKFDHSPSMRYFIEAEIDTEDINQVKDLKEKIRVFLKDILGKSEILESPGMFVMAFKKR